MKKTFKQNDGFTKLIDSIKNTKFEKIKDIGPKAYFAANLYLKHKINDVQMRSFLNTLMERYTEEKANLQLQPALVAINGSPNPPVMAAELIATIQERIDNPDKTYSSQIKIEIPLDVGWSDEKYKEFADSSDKQLMASILNHVSSYQNNQTSNLSNSLSEAATETINKYIENQLNEKKYKLYGMERHCYEEKIITDNIMRKATNRHNSICKILNTLVPEFSASDDNKTTAFTAHLNNIIDSWTVENDKAEHANASIEHIEEHGNEILSQRTHDSSENSQRTKGKLEVMDNSNENAPETHSTSMNEATFETRLPHSILKELAAESSTKAESWRTSGRFSKLESDTNETAGLADVTNKATANEQKNTESLAQQTTTAKSEKPAPNPRPKGLTLKGHTKPLTTTKTKSLQDQPSYKANAERLKKSDESTHQSSIKTHVTQTQNTQQPKPALKPKPVLTKQPKESESLNTSKSQELQKPDTHQAESEFKSNPAPHKTLDEPVHQSSIITEKNQRTESQRPNSHLKSKPAPPEKPKGLTLRSTKETTITTKANDGVSIPSPKSKPPLPKKPEILPHKQHQKPDIPPKPLKEKPVNSDFKDSSGNAEHTPILQDKKTLNTPPATLTAEFIVNKITDRLKDESYTDAGEVMSDIMKLAGQPAQLRKLLEQLDRAEKAGIEIKVIRGKEEFFRNELTLLINNNKPNAPDPDHRTGIPVKH